MLTISKVCKRFGVRSVLDNADLEAAPGEIVGVIGANGAGKTTLFRIVTNLIPSDSGTIRYTEGRRSTPLTHSMIGYLPESRSLFGEVPVGRSLEFWAQLRGMSAADARRTRDYWLERIGLKERALNRVSSLSKGNIQKLQLASCMLHSPSALILDEPFSGLDPGNQIAVSNLIRSAAQQGASVVLSAHHLELLQRLATRVVVLKGGRLVPALPSDLSPGPNCDSKPCTAAGVALSASMREDP